MRRHTGSTASSSIFARKFVNSVRGERTNERERERENQGEKEGYLGIWVDVRDNRGVAVLPLRCFRGLLCRDELIALQYRYAQIVRLGMCRCKPIGPSF
jgi:hypothetical protein